LFVGSFDKKLYALNVADGSKLWEFEAEGAIASSPLVYDNTVYIGSFDRHLYAVDTVSGKQVWRFPAGDEGEGIPGNWFWAKPVAYNGVIYAANLDGKVYALDAERGDKLNEFDLGGPISSSPVIVNGAVIFASQRGLIYTVDTTSNQLKQLADIESEVYGPLSAREGIIYVHTQDMALHRVEADTGAKLPTISLESGE
jgi:outer membrane protein assembly factor BamB